MLFLEERKPHSITWIDCHCIPFNTEGRVDLKEVEDHVRSIGGFLDLPIEKQKRDKIIDAHSVFTRKRYEREAKWSLTPELEQAIKEAIFGSSSDFPRIG